MQVPVETVRVPLKAVPMFSALSLEQLTEVAQHSKIKKLHAGERLLTQGETGSEFYVVLAGSLSLTVDGKALSTLNPGDHLGEMALLEDIPRQATADALEPCELLTLDRPALLALLKSSDFSLGLLRGMARRLREFGEKAAR